MVRTQEYVPALRPVARVQASPFQRRSRSDATAADERIMTVLAQDDREHRKRLRDLKLCYKCERPLSEGCGGIKTCQAPAVGSRVA